MITWVRPDADDPRLRRRVEKSQPVFQGRSFLGVLEEERPCWLDEVFGLAHLPPR